MKIFNIEGENLRIFYRNWGISMKFSGKIWLMVTLKVTKKPGFHLLSRKSRIKVPYLFILALKMFNELQFLMFCGRPYQI